MLKRLLRSLLLAFTAMVLFSGVTLAAWEYLFPITIVDTSNTTRAYYPVMLGFGGQTLVNASKILSSGNDTNMQIGPTPIKYMMATGNVTAVIPSLPSGGVVTTNLYTGYSPQQSVFAIITGSGGYVTVSDNDSLELGNNFTISMSGYINTANGTNKNIVYKQGAFRVYVSPTVSENITSAVTNYSTNYPVVAAVNGGNDVVNQLNHIVNLPAGIVSGNLLLAFFASDDPIGGGGSITFPAGWTQLFQLEDAGTDDDYGGWYRVADGTEGATITVNTTNTEMTSHTTYRITGYSGVPQYATATTGGSQFPDPPNLVPSWGSRSTLWIVMAGYNNGTATVNAYPANYAGSQRNDRANDTEGTGLGTATRNLVAASENPGTFTISTTVHSCSATLAVAPAWADTEVTAANVDSSNHTVTVTQHPIEYSQQYTAGQDTQEVPSYNWTGNPRQAGQTFTVSNSTCLYAVEVWGRTIVGNPTWDLAIRNTSGGLPTGGNLTTSSQATGGWGAAYAWRKFVLSPPILVSSGTQYAILVSSNDADGAKYSFWGADETAPAYAGGTKLRNDSWSDANWYTVATWDMLFRAETGGLAIIVDGTLRQYSSTTASVYNSPNNWLLFQNNVMPYADNITISINGTPQLYFAPNTMISGTNIPDRSLNSHNGTITWGSNSGISLSYGEMSSFEDFMATSNITGGFSMPTAPLSATWFATGGNVANLPFYDSFSDVAVQTGKPVQSYYFIAIIGVAFGAFLGIVMFTRSALMAYIAMVVVFAFGSSMTIIPAWIVFVLIIVGLAIMYLYRQVAY